MFSTIVCIYCLYFVSICLIECNAKSEIASRQKRTPDTAETPASMSIRTSSSCPHTVYYRGGLCAILYQEEGCQRTSARVDSGNNLDSLRQTWAKEPKSVIVLRDCRMHLCYCSRDNCATLAGEETIGVSYATLPVHECGQLFSLDCTCGSGDPVPAGMDGWKIAIICVLVLVFVVAPIVGSLILTKKKSKSVDVHSATYSRVHKEEVIVR